MLREQLEIPENAARPNVTPSGQSTVRSLCIGKSAVALGFTKFTACMWNLFELLARWLQVEAPHINVDFASIVINEGYAAERHRDDSSNVGPSVSLVVSSGIFLATMVFDPGLPWIFRKASSWRHTNFPDVSVFDTNFPDVYILGSAFLSLIDTLLARGARVDLPPNLMEDSVDEDGGEQW